MCSRSLLSLLVLLIVTLNLKASLALICFESFSVEAGWRLCWSTLKNADTCKISTNATSSLLDCDGYPNITSPRLAITVEKGFHFNVTLKNGRKIHNVRLFLTMAEQTEVDIELEYSTNYSMSCRTFGSLSKVSTNIIKSAGHTSNNFNVTFDYTNLSSFSKLVISKNEIQSGYFTCRSTGNQNLEETFKIFTGNSDWPLYPFVPHQDLTIQSDEKYNGFIIPCRTNERLHSPPMLMMSTYGKNQKMLNNEEMKTMTWDASVGFKFKTSIHTWEMQKFICRLNIDSFPSRTYRPTPNRFSKTIFVVARGQQVGCSHRQRQGSGHLQASYLENSQASFHHECNTLSECDLSLEWGTLLGTGSCSKFNVAEETLMAVPIRNSSKTFGAFTCVLWHFYGVQRVPERNTKMYFLGLDGKVYLLPGSYPNSSVIQIKPFEEVLYREHTDLYYEFTCTAVNFLRSKEIYFILRYSNASEAIAGTAYQLPDLQSSSRFRFNVQLHKSTTQALCLVITTEGRIVSVERKLQIVDAKAPVVDNDTNSSRIYRIGYLNNDLTLSCPITGAPPPKYEWKFDEKNVNLVQGTDTRNLTFLVVNNQVGGRYTCRAWNKYGNETFEYHISVKAEDQSMILSDEQVTWIAFGSVLGFVLVLATAIFAGKYFRARRQLRRLTPEEKLEFLEGTPALVGSLHNDAYDLAMHLPFTKCIESKRLVVDRTSTLGKGQYGIVYRGILHTEAVAVKTFKNTVTFEEFQACLVEVKLMQFVGDHPNIVLFIGADVTKIDNHDILIIMELSPFGSLEKHLRMIKPPVSSNCNAIDATSSDYCSADDRIVYEKLCSFCEQIAFAMEHLESKKVIHGDLAARNVLVFSHGIVKVTDFGYSRQLYENDMYKPSKARALPWRWASIELLRQNEFSTESDIWAFGITVWEIFTFGNVPFPSEKWNEHFMHSLENGLRLMKPAGLSESQYMFMKECWNLEKSVRPRFLALKSFFLAEKDNLQRGFQATQV